MVTTCESLKSSILHTMFGGSRRNFMYVPSASKMSLVQPLFHRFSSFSISRSDDSNISFLISRLSDAITDGSNFIYDKCWSIF